MTELPLPISGPSAWFGPEVAGRTDWVEPLSPAEIVEIEGAGQRLTKAEVDWMTLRPQDFPLPGLEGRLSDIMDQVLEGRGFTLLHGLPVERWGQRLSAVAFLGLGLHWGNLRPQNRQGHLLGHVIDMGLSSQDPNTRIYQTKERQHFHTDSCDVVGLLCLLPARKGGLSSLVSSVTIFNEMRRRRPDLARVLFRPIETDRRRSPRQAKAVLLHSRFQLARGFVVDGLSSPLHRVGTRFPEVPPLTAEQVEALDLFNALANDPALNFCMELSRATSSSCTITRYCTTGPLSSIGRSPSVNGTCCVFGSPPRRPGLLLPFSPSGTARRSPANGAASSFPVCELPSRGPPKAEKGNLCRGDFNHGAPTWSYFWRGCRCPRLHLPRPGQLRLRTFRKRSNRSTLSQRPSGQKTTSAA